ncbi:sigma-70 family RNA polymerase sigma factor [Micromonospora sp. WMMD812]|uniref:RNA polymerase sigma factor n=1 Tax=Micromonospora sp. WMMD812 TaxID=3015152 RepID=UPI00248CABFA|nr:sigma-70 family RNA polymerase sigma factor [Micromonospora sp. WMMD812]WBB67081.1 sigma-70 family RNA polymerase sigma factor [Micromonospora sp. WMMD812]
MHDPSPAEDDISDIGVDPAALEVFYRRHVEAVGRFVARRVDDPHLAADLTADVFLAVIESAAGYRPDRGSQIGWLFGVARNVIADERRRAAQRLRVTGRMAGRRDLDADDIARIEERIDAESAARRTYRALRELPEDTRALVELVAVDGLAVAEAATALGMSPVAARVRLHRARRTVRAVLARPATILA